MSAGKTPNKPLRKVQGKVKSSKSAESLGGNTSTASTSSSSASEGSTGQVSPPSGVSKAKDTAPVKAEAVKKRGLFSMFRRESKESVAPAKSKEAVAPSKSKEKISVSASKSVESKIAPLTASKSKESQVKKSSSNPKVPATKSQSALPGTKNAVPTKTSSIPKLNVIPKLQVKSDIAGRLQIIKQKSETALSSKIPVSAKSKSDPKISKASVLPVSVPSKSGSKTDLNKTFKVEKPGQETFIVSKKSAENKVMSTGDLDPVSGPSGWKSANETSQSSASQSKIVGRSSSILENVVPRPGVPEPRVFTQRRESVLVSLIKVSGQSNDPSAQPRQPSLKQNSRAGGLAYCTECRERHCGCSAGRDEQPYLIPSRDECIDKILSSQYFMRMLWDLSLTDPWWELAVAPPSLVPLPSPPRQPRPEEEVDILIDSMSTEEGWLAAAHGRKTKKAASGGKRGRGRKRSTSLGRGRRSAASRAELSLFERYDLLTDEEDTKSPGSKTSSTTQGPTSSPDYLVSPSTRGGKRRSRSRSKSRLPSRTRGGRRRSRSRSGPLSSSPIRKSAPPANFRDVSPITGPGSRLKSLESSISDDRSDFPVRTGKMKRRGRGRTMRGRRGRGAQERD